MKFYWDVSQSGVEYLKQSLHQQERYTEIGIYQLTSDLPTYHDLQHTALILWLNL